MEESSSGKVSPDISENTMNMENPSQEDDVIASSNNSTPAHSAIIPADAVAIQQMKSNLESIQLLDTIKQLRAELEQKDSIILLNERERTILEKEKNSVSVNF